jgi:hypothetical protein
MRLEHRAAMTAEAGRSRTAALTKAPHQFDRRRGADLKPQGSLPDRGPALHRTIRSRKSRDRGAGMGYLPADHNQPYGISSADSTQLLHALAVRYGRKCSPAP